MTALPNTHVKIKFSFFSDILDEWTVETLWAETVDAEKGWYKLDNIPFHAAAACGDIVLAEYDTTEEFLMYREIIEPSGNSTIQVVMMDKTIPVQEIRAQFEALGCASEGFGESYFVMEVLATISYVSIRQHLMALEAKGYIGYAEPHLAENHWY